MNKKLLISFLSVLIFSSVSVMADDTATTTDARPQPPQFENGTPPDFTKGQGVNEGVNDGVNNGVNIANPPRDFKGSQKSQFNGRRPSKKPDSKPGGDRTPPNWDSSVNGQNIQDGQPPQFNGSIKDRPPKPPKEKSSASSTES